MHALTALPKTFTTTVRHSLSELGLACFPGTGSLKEGGSSGVGGFDA